MLNRHFYVRITSLSYISSSRNQHIRAQQHFSSNVRVFRCGGCGRRDFSIHADFINHIAAILGAIVILEKQQIASRSKTAPTLHKPVNDPNALRNSVVYFSQSTLDSTSAASAINSTQLLPFLQNHRVIFRGIASVLLIEEFPNERNSLLVANSLNDRDHFFAG